LWIAVLMLACGLALVGLLPAVVKQVGLHPREVRLAGLILLAPVLLIPFSAFRSLAEVQQRGSIVNILLTGQSLLTTACLLTAAHQGWGLAGQSLGIVVAQVPATAFLMGRGLRRVPGLSGEKRDAETTSRLWSLNWQTLVQNVCGRVGLLSDNIIVSWGMGAAAVAPFYLTQRLGYLVQTQLQGVGNSTWASLMELHYRKQHRLFEERLVELTALVSGLGAVGLGVVFAYNRDFVGFWTGSASFAGETLTLIACFNGWIWAISSLWGWPISGAGEVGRWVPFALLFVSVNLAASVMLVKALGWVGPLLGTTAGFLLVNSWAQPRLLRQIFGVPVWSLWRAALKPLRWALPYSALVYVIAHAHQASGVRVLPEMGLAGAGGVGLWWLCGLKPESRNQWQSRLRIAFARS
jgi:O-antigen/teichoic acid export membrane protein